MSKQSRSLLFASATICLTLSSILLVEAAPQSATKRFLDAFHSSTVSPADKIKVCINILETASKEPATFSSNYDGTLIYKANNVPFILGIITSKRDNPNYPLWKENLEIIYVSSTDAEMKSLSALALSRMGNKIAIEALFPLLKNTDNDVLREMAIAELGKSKIPSAIPLLEDILNGKETPAVEFVSGKPKYFYPIKSAAEQALIELGAPPPPGVAAATREDVINQLAEYLNMDLTVALASAHCLTQIGTPEALAVLESFVKNHETDNPQPHVISDIQARLTSLQKRRADLENIPSSTPSVSASAANKTTPQPFQTASPVIAAKKQVASSSSFRDAPLITLGFAIFIIVVIIIRRKKS